jgi:hypothetical protein
VSKIVLLHKTCMNTKELEILINIYEKSTTYL